MSNLVGKRVQVVLTLGNDASGAAAFEVAATEIDANTMKQVNPHVAMNMVHRAMGLYLNIVQSTLPKEPEPQIVVPAHAGMRLN